MKRTICFTGKLKNFTRSAASAACVRAGLTPVGFVHSGLDWLVAADPDSGSSKMKEAKKYGVKVISEDEFVKLTGVDPANSGAFVKPNGPLDWKKCCKAICDRLGMRLRHRSTPDFSTGVDRRAFAVELYYEAAAADGVDLGGKPKKAAQMLASSDDAYRLGLVYEGRPFALSPDEKYLSLDEAYKKMVWMLGTKLAFTVRADVNWWRWRIADADLKRLNAIRDSFPTFGMPDSPDELKLRLEVMGWSIL